MSLSSGCYIFLNVGVEMTLPSMKSTKKGFNNTEIEVMQKQVELMSSDLKTAMQAIDDETKSIENILDDAKRASEIYHQKENLTQKSIDKILDDAKRASPICHEKENLAIPSYHAQSRNYYVEIYAGVVTVLLLVLLMY